MDDVSETQKGIFGVSYSETTIYSFNTEKDYLLNSSKQFEVKLAIIMLFTLCLNTC